MRKLLVLLLLLAGLAIWYWSDAAEEPLDEEISPGIDQEATIAIQLFFGSTEADPQSLHCNVVYPVTRHIPQTPTPARSALELLLEGPSPEEQTRGYFTSINSGVEVENLRIEAGRARAEFNQALDENVAGSCRVTAIRSQIESTLRQFESIREVEIVVNGQTETVLQP